MDKITDYARCLISSGKLEDKLLPPPANMVYDEFSGEVPEKPERDLKIQFSDKKSKIPRLEHLNDERNRAVTLHHFANHELMAIELFAYALLKFPELPRKFREDLVKTIKEEQKHLRLYLNRMNELGIELGEKPLNYLFWKQIPLMKTPEKFFTIMSLSFEGANLDYSVLYEKCFDYFEDSKSSKIMQTIYKDELKHVNRGLKIFRHYIPDKKDEWEHYNSLIQFPFTPRRAKGYIYIPQTREKAGFNDKFILELGKYHDKFSNRVKSPVLDLIWPQHTD